MINLRNTKRFFRLKEVELSNFRSSIERVICINYGGMRFYNIRQLINISKYDDKISTMLAAVIVFFMSNPVCAQNNLEKAKTALETLRSELTGKIIPVAAAVILLCLAIGYAGRYIERGTFVRWAVGVVIAGSATQIAEMLFKSQ